MFTAENWGLVMMKLSGNCPGYFVFAYRRMPPTVPAGIAGNVLRPEEVTLKDSLMIAAGGILVFTVGWLLQQTTKPR